MQDVSVYVHAPFCLKKCHYCDFYSIPHTALLENRFVEAVLQEVELRISSPKKASTIYFGGGTPTLLSEKALKSIFKKISAKYFVSEDCEITIEANPKTITKKKAETMMEIGINRISLGVQSLYDDVLKILGRPQNKNDSIEALKILKNSGFENISLDLIIGKPFDDIKRVKEEVKKIIELNPSHVSAYILSVPDGSLLGQKLKNGELAFPDEDEIHDIYLATSETLEDAGFNHYEISNFAGEGKSSRHNGAYWKRLAYDGFGPSASSFSPKEEKRWKNKELPQYINDIRNSRLPIEWEERLSADDVKNETIMLTLRTSEGVKLDSLSQEALEKTKRFVQQKLAFEKGGRMILTKEGFLLSNTIIREITD